MIAISLCMIVKNEEAILADCLISIAQYADEVIIVDTGSADRTKEIALQFTDKVYDYQWTNDFAAARNFSISKASNDFILVIDSDEITERIDMDEIKKLAAANPTKIGRLLRVNEFTRKDNPYKYSERVNRLFSKKYYEYEGIIHEQVVPLGKAIIVAESTEDTYFIPLTIRHSGYEGDLDTRKKKTDRNISLLKSALENAPEDPYLIYQLGKSYYMEEDYLSACNYFGDALFYDLNPKLEYVQDMVESYGYSLLNTGKYDVAMQLLNVYDEFSHSTDFIFLSALILMNNEKFSRAIEEFLKATKMEHGKMEGVNSFLSFYNIGVIFECLGEIEQAKVYYKLCETYEPALARLNI